MNEAEKQAAIAAAQAKIDLAHEAMQQAIEALAAAVRIVVSAAPVLEPTPVAEATLPYATLVSAAGDKTVTVPADARLVKDQIIVQLGNGQSVNVTGVAAQGSNAVLTIDQAVKAADVVGKSATVKARYATAPTTSSPVVTTPVVETPVVTEPVVTPPSTGATVTAQFKDYGGDWPNGIWQASDKGGLTLVYSDEAAAAFVVGATVTFSDGSKRVVQSAEVSSVSVKLWTDGGKIDKALGAPGVLSVAKPLAVEAPVYNTTPIVTTPGSKRGRLCLNLGAGAGGDSVLPGEQGHNRGYASEAEIVFAVNVLKCRHYRLGGLWETFIQPGGKSELYTGQVNGGPSAIDEMIRVLASLADKGCTAMPDPFHNYGGYSNTGTSADRIKVGDAGGPSVQRLVLDHKAVLMGVKANAKAWSALTEYDTMNEWVGVSAANIKAFHQEFLNVCGPIMDGKVPVIEGDLWSSTVNWVTLNPGYADLTYPAGVSKVKCSGHLYLDQASSGFYNGDKVSDLDAAAGITTDNIGVKRMAAMEADVKAKGLTMNIGEHMVPGNLPNLIKGSENMIRHCIANGIDVHIFADSTWLDETHNILMPKNKPFLDMLMGIWAQEAV